MWALLGISCSTCTQPRCMINIDVACVLMKVIEMKRFRRVYVAVEINISYSVLAHVSVYR